MEEADAFDAPEPAITCPEDAVRVYGEEFTAIEKDLASLHQILHDTVEKMGLGFRMLQSQIQAQTDLLSSMVTLLTNATDTSGGDGTTLNFREFTVQTGEILQQFVDHVVRTSTDSLELVHRISDMSTQMKEINGFVSGAKRIADQTKLLALNATIESARAGEAGQCFAVVAKEVKALAQTSNGFSDQIGQSVSSARRTMEEAKHVIETLASSDMTFAIDAKIRVDAMLSQFADVNESIRSRLDQATGYARQIEQGVSLSVTALQFEDIAGQLVTQIQRRFEALVPRTTDLLRRSLATQGAGGMSSEEIEREVAQLRSEIATKTRRVVAQESMSSGAIELF